MGILLWAGSGFVAFLLARIIPHRRGRRWKMELIATIVTALFLGVAATALDFGGWGEADWRAGLFAFFGALAAAGVSRAAAREAPAGPAP